MLSYIHIQNLAIVEQLAIDLQAGMTVLSGETGAGKSILVDALALALGNRSDSTFIREGSAQAEVSVQFDLHDVPEAARWLQKQALAQQENECILRRVLPRKGRSRGFINGRPVPIQSLRELGELLVDIHGQHVPQSLLRRDYQRQLLDEYGDHKEQLQALEKLWLRTKQAENQLHEQRARAEQAAARRELLQYQIRELQALHPEEGEYTKLEAEYKQLSHAAELLATCHRVLDALSERTQTAVQFSLGRCLTDLSTMQEADPALQVPREMLNNALIQTEEVIAELSSYRDAVRLDPEHKNEVEERLHGLNSLAANHHVPPEELPAHLAFLLEELHALARIDSDTQALQEEIAQLHADFREVALVLSAQRKIVAETLSVKATATMRQLGMPQGQFEIQCLPEKEEKRSPHGMDKIDFMVSANPGQPLQALTKVASGGELSRISLALQVETVRTGSISTLIFDEVDVGIGGGVAEVVGRLLRALGKQRQVICITHLPQVASQGHHHYQVKKQSRAGVTRTFLQSLTAKPRVREIARMLGGIKITEQSLAHAQEMLGIKPLAK